MNSETRQATRQIMAELAQTPHRLLGECVIEIGSSRWMLPGGRNFIIQLELMHDTDRAILFSTIARDGSGPLKASFLTMLLLEDTVANTQKQYGVCSGFASVTLYRFFDLCDITAARMAASLSNFIGLNEIIFADYLARPVVPDMSDEREIA